MKGAPVFSDRAAFSLLEFAGVERLPVGARIRTADGVTFTRLEGNAWARVAPNGDPRTRVTATIIVNREALT